MPEVDIENLSIKILNVTIGIQLPKIVNDLIVDAIELIIPGALDSRLPPLLNDQIDAAVSGLWNEGFVYLDPMNQTLIDYNLTSITYYDNFANILIKGITLD